MANRKDRRKFMKQQNLTEMPRVKTYNISEDQVRDMAQKAADERIEEVKIETTKWCTNCLLASFVISLHHTMGFGLTRIKRVMSEVNSQFEAIGNNVITEKDLLKCAEDIGVIIREGKEVYIEKNSRNLSSNKSRSKDNTRKSSDT